MKNTPKRLLALILALAMTLSLLSSAAWAAEFQPENTRNAETVQLAEEASSSSTEEQAEISDEDLPGDTELPSEPEDDPPEETELPSEPEPSEPEDDPPGDTELPSEPEEDTASHEDEAESSEAQTEDAEQESAEEPTQEEEAESATDSSEAEPDQSEELPTVPEDVEEALREQMIEETASDPSCATAQDEIPWFDNASDAVAYVRSKAVERINSIDILVPKAVCRQLDLGEGEDGCTDVLAHTGNPREGDFINGSLCYNRAKATQQNDGRWKVQYYFVYWDSPDQIQAIEQAVSAVVNKLDLKNNDLSDYEKVKRIYDYITSHVTYAYDAKDARESHSAYGAFVNHHCVCQGYALMFYRLALEAGLDSRFISGTVSEPHAWNIVNVKGVWYLADVTWDAGRSEYFYFLRGKYDFGHDNSDDNFHRIEGFSDAYPLSDFFYGTPDSYGTAPCYTLVTTDDQTVTTTAENGRAKVLLFFSDQCVFSTALIQDMAEQEFPGVDIVAANTGNIDTLELIGSFFPSSFPGVYTECCTNYEAMRTFEDLTGIKDNWVHSPTIFLVNAQNQVIYGAHGYDKTLTAAIQRLLVNPDAQPPAEDPVDYGYFRCMGVCGDNAVWRFYNNGTLRISGTGPLWDKSNKMRWYKDVEDAYNHGAKKYFNDSRPVEPWLYNNQVKRVIIDEGITCIGGSMFYQMDNLEDLYIPTSVIQYPSAGNRPALRKQDVTVHGVSDSAANQFAKDYQVLFVPSDTDTPTVWYSGSCGENVRWSFDNSLTLTISGTGAMTDYDDNHKSPWKQYKVRKVVIQPGVTHIGSYAFYWCENITSISISNTVTSFGERAFYYCTGLTSVTIPGSLKSFGAYAFYHCTGLTSVTIPGSVESFGDYAFSHCTGLTSVTISDGVTSLGNRAFCDCSNLKTITIPTSVTSIGYGFCTQYNDTTHREEPIPGVTISGYTNSAIQWYAQDYGFSFNSIGVADLSGACGESVSWSIDADRTLTISGTGAMADYDYNNESPWKQYRVRKVVIQPGVTYIGNQAFCWCETIASISIPNTVTSFGDFAFSDCTGLTSVTIPGSLKSFGDWAFSHCTGLTSVTISDGVTSVGDNAFSSCTSLKTITIPASVTSFGYGFCTQYNDTTQREEPIPGVTISGFTNSAAQRYAQDYGFSFNSIGVVEPPSGSYGSNVTWSVDADRTLTISGTGAIADYNNIDEKPWKQYKVRKVVIQPGVTSIGDYSFSRCESITNISIPNTVTSFGEGAFCQCTGLTSVTIPSSVTSLGSYAFSHCTGLTSVAIPESVESVGSYAFSNCTSLTSVTISDGVTSLGHRVFNSCTSLKTITIPASVTSIGNAVFVLYNYTTQREEPIPGVTISGYTNSAAHFYAQDYGFSFNSIGVVDLSGACGESVSWSIDADQTLTISGTGAMADYDYNNESPWKQYRARKVVIQPGVTHIGNQAFYLCETITSISIPNTVTSLGDFAISSCTGLTSVTIPDGVTSLGNYVFNSCTSLKTITIPASVTSIGERVCMTYNDTTHREEPIPGLTMSGYTNSAAHFYAKDYNFSFNSIGVAELSGACGKSVSWSIDADRTLTISGTGAMADYDDNHESPWKQYKVRKVVIQPGVTYIGSQAFYWCETITSISIPNTVTSLGDFAFSGCTGLTSVTIPGSLKSLGYCAFSQCTGLTSVTIPGSLKSLDNTFVGCTGLTTVSISDGVTSLNGAFAECTSLKTITIPTSVTSIAADECMNYNDTVQEWEPIPGVTIIGYTNSAAQRFAVENGFSFRSLSKSIKGAVVTATEQTYTSKPITPAVTVKLNGKTLKKDTDYTVACSNNTNAGKVAVTVSGTGKYTGSVSGSFNIKKANQSFTVTPTVVEAGKAVTLSVKGGYGTLSFASSNQKVATVTSRGVVKGVKNGTVSITIKAAGDKNHNAAAVTHKMTVSLPSAPDVKKVENVLNGVQITAGTMKGAAGYRFFCKEGSGTWKKIGDSDSSTFTWKKAQNGKTYTFAVRCLDKSGALVTDYSWVGRSITFVKAPTLSSVKNTKAKTVSAAWTKLTGVNGFQIQYSTNKSFKNGNKTVPVNKGSAVSQVITKLSKGKTYSFRIRSSMKISGKTVYSAWSAAKSLKITK